MPRRQTVTITEQRVSTVHRVSIGLIAISLSLMSLALGTALFVSPGAAFLFLPGSVEVASVPSTATAVTLTWTAPGDDGAVGQAASYDIRYSTAPISEDNFNQAGLMPDRPAPAPAGETQTVTMTGLAPATTYFFALKTTDDAGNTSAISNIATKTTDALAVACVPTYTCSEWTACSGGQQTRTCTVNNGCPAGLDAPIATQSCTTPDQGGQPAHVVQNIIVAGLAPGRTTTVRVINPSTKKTTKEFLAFAKADRTGVHTAAGDINGDHQADVVVGTGIGTDSLVKVFSTQGKLITSFNPYSTERQTGVSVATGDLNGDGIDEIITVPAKSSAQIRAWRYDTTSKKFTRLAQLFAYDRSQRQGFTVASGDLDGDGRAEIAVTARTNARSVAVLRLTSSNALQVIKRFNPYPIQYTTGLTLAIGDVFGTGRGNIITTGGPGYYSDVKIFDIKGKSLNHFLAISQSYRNGLSLTALDVNRDGRDEIIAGPYRNGEPWVYVYRYDGLRKKFSRMQNYLVYPRTIQNGLRLGSI